MTASKGPTLLIAQLRKAADRRPSADPRGCIFTNAADCLDAQAEKIRRQRDEIAALRKRLQQNTTNDRAGTGPVHELERQITRPAPCARHCEAQAFKLEIRALERQIADLQKDAERYRRIRRGQHWSLVNGIGDVLTGEDMDKAVDAAIKAKVKP